MSAEMTYAEWLAARNKPRAPDPRDAEIATLREREERLREALEPFAAFAAKVEDRYRKRGGNPDSFPDTHPFADVAASDLNCGVWRAARAALAPAP